MGVIYGLIFYDKLFLKKWSFVNKSYHFDESIITQYFLIFPKKREAFSYKNHKEFFLC
jgi:hypothetical protein